MVGYAGTHVPMFVTRLDLMKPGLQVMKIAHHHANGYLAVQQIVNPFERNNFCTVLEIKKFKSVHPVIDI